jgi:hypothetical protein
MALHPKVERLLGIRALKPEEALYTPMHKLIGANRADASQYVEQTSNERVESLLSESVEDLQKRIWAKVRGHAPNETFTLKQMNAALAQIKDTLFWVTHGLQNIMLDMSDDAAVQSADDTIHYLEDMDRLHRGIGTTPIALREASVMDNAVEGARSSVLRNIASSGEPVEGADEEPAPAKYGVLQRYGINTIDHFEGEMRKGLVTQKTWAEMEDALINKSAFLQGKPGFWAKRIVRTEVMGAYARSSWEVIRDADEQLGDMTKFLVATFDDRTGSDSYAVHGQCRRPEEAFESWYGLYQHPPNRPNDREIVVPHRISWPIPAGMRALDNGAVAARWRLEGNKKPVPPRPLMTTVPFALFGKTPPPQIEREQEDNSTEQDDGDTPRT